jgi:hypothetical protein
VAVILKAMETRSANTAPALATAGQRRCGMSKALAVIYYTATMAVFKRWLAIGIIREDELIKIEATIAQKYGLSEHSIYRQNA